MRILMVIMALFMTVSMAQAGQVIDGVKYNFVPTQVFNKCNNPASLASCNRDKVSGESDGAETAGAGDVGEGEGGETGGGDTGGKH